jgi:hypothetical protein
VLDIFAEEKLHALEISRLVAQAAGAVCHPNPPRFDFAFAVEFSGAASLCAVCKGCVPLTFLSVNSSLSARAKSFVSSLPHTNPHIPRAHSHFGTKIPHFSLASTQYFMVI